MPAQPAGESNRWAKRRQKSVVHAEKLVYIINTLLYNTIEQPVAPPPPRPARRARRPRRARASDPVAGLGAENAQKRPQHPC